MSSDVLLVHPDLDARCFACDKPARVAWRADRNPPSDCVQYFWYCLRCWRLVDEAYSAAERRSRKTCDYGPTSSTVHPLRWQ